MVIIGLLGIIGCVVWLIVTLFTHRRKRWPAIGIGVAVILFIVGAVLLPRPSALEMGVSRWEKQDYEGAKDRLSQIDKDHEDYDSAQKLLERLPDTAFAYYVEQAEENLKVEEFEKAIRNCDEALRYQPDNPTVLKLKAQIQRAEEKALVAEEEAARETAAEEAKRQKAKEEAAKETKRGRPLNEWVESGNWSFRVSKVRTVSSISDGLTRYTAGNGIFVIVTVDAFNDTKRPRRFYFSDNIALYDDAGNKYTFDSYEHVMVLDNLNGTDPDLTQITAQTYRSAQIPIWVLKGRGALHLKISGQRVKIDLALKV